VPKLFFHYARDLGMNWPLRAGAAVCLYPERATAEVIFALIAKYRPSILLNVPTMMRSMLKSPEAGTADLSSVRLCLSSGELLSEQLHNDFTRTFGVKVVNVHGSAETYLAHLLHRPGDVLPGSSGKIAPLVEVKIVDTQGNEVPEGETGILRVRSDACGTGYHCDPEESMSTFVGDGWVNTNDLFRVDKDGYFWFMGRATDLIKVSGIYVAPLEVEKCLEQHPAVRECVVVGVPDADGLLKCKAFVALRSGFEPSRWTAGELNEFCRANIARHKAPRLIEFLAELPKTGQGKIDKQQLLLRDSAGRSNRNDYAFATV
jgi:acyl-coenzyme A synthetase/AMP-(fatty) acid ligase